MRDFIVAHFTVDGEINNDDYYVTNYDGGCLMFRTTFYNNVYPGDPAPGPHRIGVEIIRGKTDEGELPYLLEETRQELLRYGLIKPGARFLYQKAHLFKNVFPVVTPAFAANATRHLEVAQQECQNVLFLGRATNDCFFLPQVLPRVYTVLGAMLGQANPDVGASWEQAYSLPAIGHAQ
jgi:hypothetical protein